MKKLNFTFLFTMLMSMVGLNASAHDIEVQNADGKTIYYIFINNNTELAVTFKGLGSSSNINRYTGNVVIPESVTYNEKTYSVTSIGESAFQYCSGLTSVTIGSGVTSIGSQAFEDCTGLTSVTIGSGVTSIGSSAFKNCSDLTSIEIPNSVTSIVGGAFKGCSGLTSVTINSNAILSSSSKLSIFGSQVEQYIIGNSVTSIGSSAFYNCYGMTSITIPNSVTSIGEGAFSYCSGLTSITIPNSVTSIGNFAFSLCYGLTSITIPNSVTSIGMDAFSGCSGLTSIMVENGNSKYDSRDNCNAIIETSSNTLIRGCKNTEIPNSVTSIGDYAFDGCSGLTSIDIPNSVTSIGYKAFQSCSGLTSIEIPNSVTSIGGYAFSFCSGLTSVTIPNSVTSIGGYAFSYCSGLTSVNSLIETPFTVGTSDFESISNACVLTVPKGTRDAYLAAGWTEDVFKGGVVEETGDNIIFADANVKAICVANWDTNSDGELSYDEAEAVTNLGSVFRNKTSITSFDELQYFTGLTSIGNTAFYNCSGLTSVTIPNSVTSIGEGAFYNCSGLTSIEIPNSVTSIGQYAFCGCSGLTSIIIPNSVTIIESFAFEYCSGLTSIDIPNSVTSIGSAAFEGCSGLTSIDIPNSVTSIGQFAFFECTGLTSIEIPNSVTSIGERAFSGCSGLTSVTIPNSVTSIGSAAFENCSGLTSVKSEIETPFAFGTSAFNSISNACVLTVPKGTRDAYLAAGWTEDVFKGGVVEDEIIEDVTIAMKTGSGADRTMIGYSSQYSLDFTDVTEVKAYIAIGFTSTKNVIMARVNIVPANTGVVLKSDVAGVEVEVPITTEDVYYANLLKPAVDNVTVYPSETIDDVDYTNLMVGTLINGQTGFITFSTPKAYSNKCYLRVPTEFYNSAAVASNGLEVVFVDSDATDIHQLMQDNDTTGDAFYDLYGRKVTPNKKGLYIRNGKKVFIQ